MKKLSLKKLLCASAFILASAQSSNAIADDSKKVDNKNSYFVQTNLVANKTKYKAESTDKKLINAWGIAIRPAGKGGHFWVTGKDISFEYVGDVKNSDNKELHKLHTDSLPYVKLPVGGDDKFSTGVVFSGSSDSFVITQNVDKAEAITAPAKFLFASDGGVISAWTERKKDDGKFDWPKEAISVIDNSKNGAQYFGLAINANYDKLYAADFGVNPKIEVFDGEFKLTNINFKSPFDENNNGKVDAGEYAPFNVQALKTPSGDNNIFVAYAKTQACPEEEIKEGNCKKGEIFAGEEDTSKAGYGKVVEYTEDGEIVKIINDDGKLLAPWGLVYAPENFGKYSNALLVSNFGDGTIAAYDTTKNEFIGYLQNEKGQNIVIKQIWGLLFGNGESLGDKDALYFAAGPDDEVDGLFGSLRLANPNK